MHYADCILKRMHQPQSIQSARISLQSSELAPPAPSPAGVCCTPLVPGGDTLACGRGGGGGSQFGRRGRHSGTPSIRSELTPVLKVSTNTYSTLCSLFYRLGKRRRADIAESSTSSSAAAANLPVFSIRLKEERSSPQPYLRLAHLNQGDGGADLSGGGNGGEASGAAAARGEDVGITMNFVEALLR
jgi:hypothetical protein